MERIQNALSRLMPGNYHRFSDSDTTRPYQGHRISFRSSSLQGALPGLFRTTPNRRHDETIRLIPTELPPVFDPIRNRYNDRDRQDNPRETTLRWLSDCRPLAKKNNKPLTEGQKAKCAPVIEALSTAIANNKNADCLDTLNKLKASCKANGEYRWSQPQICYIRQEIIQRTSLNADPSPSSSRMQAIGKVSLQTQTSINETESDDRVALLTREV